MSDMNPTLRLLSYLGAILLSVLVVAALIIGNWLAARPTSQEPLQRLRWVAFAKTNIVQGSAVKADQLQWRLSRLPDGSRYVFVSQMAVDRYALGNISEGACLNRDDFNVFAPDDAPAGGAVIPVEVKTEHVASLKPFYTTEIAILSDVRYRESSNQTGPFN